MKWLTHQFIRALHVSICFCVMLPLLLRPSVLHRMVIKRENLVHGGLYLVFFVAALCAYFIASYADPGYLTFEKARIFRHRRGNSSVCGDHSPGGDTSQYTALSDSKDPQNSGANPTDEEFHPWWLDFSHLFQWLTYPFSSLCGENVAFEEPTTYNLPVPVRYCRRCLLEQPLRCRHCPDCNRCVIKFDHHCPWIANCVGERNHSSFVVFLALQTLVLWWTLYLACASIVPNYRWADWFRTNGLVFAEIFILSVAGIPLTALLGFHIYLALANRTTWETVSHERIVYLQHLNNHTNPFNQGCAKNCYSFCCSPFPFGWDRIYAEAVEKQISASPARCPMRAATTAPVTCSIVEADPPADPVPVCQPAELLAVIPNTPKDPSPASGSEPVNI